MTYESRNKGIGTTDKLRDYDAFISKFEIKKTTDDCYTPPEVFDAVTGWLIGEGLIAADAKIVRPFFPGKDYQREQYHAAPRWWCTIHQRPTAAQAWKQRPTAAGSR